jgi:hypothetical protein
MNSSTVSNSHDRSTSRIHNEALPLSNDSIDTSADSNSFLAKLFLLCSLLAVLHFDLLENNQVRS